MAETIETQEPPAPSEAAGRFSTTGLLLIGGVGLCAFLVSLLLPDRPPILIDGSWRHWLHFGEQILRDVLIAAALTALAIGLSLFFPRIGLFLERIILRSRRRSFLICTAGLAVLTSAMFSYFALAHMPHIQDEIAMLFQAKVLAGGRLYASTPALIDSFDYEFIVADGPRWYGKYFLTPSLLMVPGVWLGVPWLISPILAGIAVLLTYGIGVSLLSEKLARIAVVLMVISPCRVSLFAMMMAHPSCMVAIGLFILGLVRLVKNPRSTGWALAAGLGLALAINARPLTALALGGTAGLIAAFTFPWRRLRPAIVPALLLPVVLGLAVYFAYNYALTGDPLLAPFSKWSPYDHLGFGPEVGLEYAPEADIGHSFEKAMFRNTYYNLDAVGTHLTGWGRVTLLLLALPVLLHLGGSGGVRSLLPESHKAYFRESASNPFAGFPALALAASVASLAIAYFFYYTPSVIVGQARYWSEAMPMMMLLLALALAAVRCRLPLLCRSCGTLPAARTGRAATWLTALLLTLLGLGTVHRPLVGECHDLWGQGPYLRDRVAEQGLQNALVFLPADHYREFARKYHWDVYAAGFALNEPELNSPVVFARDLGERNAELIAAYPGRALYRINLRKGTAAEIEPLTAQSATQPQRAR